MCLHQPSANMDVTTTAEAIDDMLNRTAVALFCEGISGPQGINETNSEIRYRALTKLLMIAGMEFERMLELLPQDNATQAELSEIQALHGEVHTVVEGLKYPLGAVSNYTDLAPILDDHILSQEQGLQVHAANLCGFQNQTTLISATVRLPVSQGPH